LRGPGLQEKGEDPTDASPRGRKRHSTKAETKPYQVGIKKWEKKKGENFPPQRGGGIFTLGQKLINRSKTDREGKGGNRYFGTAGRGDDFIPISPPTEKKGLGVHGKNKTGTWERKKRGGEPRPTTGPCKKKRRPRQPQEGGEETPANRGEGKGGLFLSRVAR